MHRSQVLGLVEKVLHIEIDESLYDFTTVVIAQSVDRNGPRGHREFASDLHRGYLIARHHRGEQVSRLQGYRRLARQH